MYKIIIQSGDFEYLNSVEKKSANSEYGIYLKSNVCGWYCQTLSSTIIKAKCPETLIKITINGMSSVACTVTGTMHYIADESLHHHFKEND